MLDTRAILERATYLFKVIELQSRDGWRCFPFLPPRSDGNAIARRGTQLELLIRYITALH